MAGVCPVCEADVPTPMFSFRSGTTDGRNAGDLDQPSKQFMQCANGHDLFRVADGDWQAKRG
jgi:hypothetical protein